jgi:hypothetical protein
MSMNAALLVMARWVVLIGGLVIIADLATQAIMQRSTGQDVLDQLDSANKVINVVLFSILGAVVARQTGLFYLSALAGLLASLLDAAVVLTASSMAPPPGGTVPVDTYLLLNVAFGVIPAGISGFVSSLVERASGPRSR